MQQIINENCMKIIKHIVIGLLGVISIIAITYYLCIEFGIEKSNPNNYATIGDIPTPEGFVRIDGDDPKYSEFLRSLPLKPKGTVVKYYWGGIAVGNYSNISFLAANGNILSYDGEKSKESLKDYLREVFRVANTYSLSRQMDERELADIQPGDVFVYPAPNSNSYGHAVMVADVAQNQNTGKKAIMLVEGFIPARNIHVMRNSQDSSVSPWFILDEESDTYSFSLFQFRNTDLKCFPPQ